MRLSRVFAISFLFCILCFVFGFIWPVHTVEVRAEDGMIKISKLIPFLRIQFGDSEFRESKITVFLGQNISKNAGHWYHANAPRHLLLDAPEYIYALTALEKYSKEFSHNVAINIIEVECSLAPQEDISRLRRDLLDAFPVNINSDWKHAAIYLYWIIENNSETGMAISLMNRIWDSPEKIQTVFDACRKSGLSGYLGAWRQ